MISSPGSWPSQKLADANDHVPSMSTEIGARIDGVKDKLLHHHCNGCGDNGHRPSEGSLENGETTVDSRLAAERAERDPEASSKTSNLKLLLQKIRLTFARTTGTRIDGDDQRWMYAQTRSKLTTVSTAILERLVVEGLDSGRQVLLSEETATLANSLISAIRAVDAAEKLVSDNEQQRIEDEYEITELFREVAPFDDAFICSSISAKLHARNGVMCGSEMPDTASEPSMSLTQPESYHISHISPRKRLRGAGIEAATGESSDDSADDFG